MTRVLPKNIMSWVQTYQKFRGIPTEPRPLVVSDFAEMKGTEAQLTHDCDFYDEITITAITADAYEKVRELLLTADYATPSDSQDVFFRIGGEMLTVGIPTYKGHCVIVVPPA